MTPSVKLTKRLIDIAGSLVGLILNVAIIPFVAIAIRLDSKGPILFRQKRCGRLISGSAQTDWEFEEFMMYKFRTMHVDAEKVSGPVIASENDPRVTRVGRFLRKSRMDELPQLWNVLLGDMSLVGPRPERPAIIKNLALAIPFFEERMRGVKPGVTGLAQISLDYSGNPRKFSEVARFAADLTNPFEIESASGAEADGMRYKLLFDLAYVASLEKFWTFLHMEASILLKTPWTMLRGIGR